MSYKNYGALRDFLTAQRDPRQGQMLAQNNIPNTPSHYGSPAEADMMRRGYSSNPNPVMTRPGPGWHEQWKALKELELTGKVPSSAAPNSVHSPQYLKDRATQKMRENQITKELEEEIKKRQQNSGTNDTSMPNPFDAPFFSNFGNLRLR